MDYAEFVLEKWQIKVKFRELRNQVGKIMTSISDALTRIRNAQAVEKESVSVPFSNFVFDIAKVLKKEGFVGELKKKGKQPKKELIISLKYQEGDPFISSLKMVSKPGQRIYKGCKDLRKVKGGRGIFVISTSQGVMSDREARKKKAGGEIICEVW